MTAPMMNQLLERFRNALAEQLGWAVEDSKLGHLMDLLNARSSQHGADAVSYVEHFERHADHDEIRALSRELTVAETYFFRNSEQFAALRAIVSSEYASCGKRLSLLSAGCASGEEAYSLAIVLRELLPNRAPAILAFDINPAILERAREGHCSAWSLRETPAACRARWFQQRGRESVVDESIRGSVEFRAGNLAVDDGELFYPNAYDIIFCRNVLMYFTPSKCRETVARLARSLAPGGYLFLGSAETLRGLSHDFQLCHTHGTFYYRRKASTDHAGPPGVDAVPLPVSSPNAQVFGAQAAVLPDPAQWVDTIGRAAARIHALAHQPPVPEGTAVGRGPGLEATPRSDLSVPLGLLHKERFIEALACVRALPVAASRDPDTLLLTAVLLASGGELVESEQTCSKLLELDELNAGAHYVLALCSSGHGHVDKAAYHDRVATYLDPDFAMPRLHLGLLLRRAGNRAAAHLELTHARSLLEREDAARLLMFGGGFGRSALLALCSAELAATGVSA